MYEFVSTGILCRIYMGQGSQVREIHVVASAASAEAATYTCVVRGNARPVLLHSRPPRRKNGVQQANAYTKQVAVHLYVHPDPDVCDLH